MKIHEHQTKELFSDYAIPVEQHTLCTSPAEAVAAYRRMNVKRAVVKAQVLTGGRGKAGGVKLVEHEEDVYQAATDILNMEIKGLPVRKILLSEAVDIAAEFYVGLTIDRTAKAVTLMLSAAGGMEIEEVAAKTPEKIIRYPIDPLVGMPAYLARRFAFELFKQPEQVTALTAILQSLYKLFLDKDVSMVEINPLVLTAKGELIAVDGKMTFDDNALYRHPDVQALFEPTEEERIEAEAKAKGISYIQTTGNVGCMVNGAGLAMTTMDLIKLYGGSPANFLDVGGSSSPTKVMEAMELLLRDKQVKVVLVNIFGGITRGADIAQGLVETFKHVKSDIPVVVRLTGTDDAAGRRLLADDPRFRLAMTLEEATHLALDIVKQQNSKL
ncbi:MAG: ADP-forming succinate--CoA ligase subunit beta [Prevotellaceae bacterium]|jgi:succinyl-CoA synthetase beta subunit|nr:ADP-forming succinate--CoA ligase subunit beta [Prevotellaceae bacterium]